MADHPTAQAPPDADRLARLEERLARIETHLGISLAAVSAPAEEPELTPAPHVVPRTEDDLEFEIGQSWFARAGIAALTIGAAFLISLPFANSPVALPALVGFALAAGLIGARRVWRESLAPVAGQITGAAMVLMLVATLRLFFPETRQAMDLDTFAGRGLLLAMVALNFLLALHRRSPWLTALAMITGGAAVVVAGDGWFALPLLLVVVGVTQWAGLRHDWPNLEVVAPPIACGAYLLWALGNPLHTGVAHFVTTSRAAPLVLLAIVESLALGPWLRPREDSEGPRVSVAALLNCGLGYGVFFVHTFGAFRADLAPMNLGAFLVFLGVAIAFWVQQQSRVATFFYAMTGYAALSVAIIKASTVPAVFVWLSVQSVVVVATAIWFCSRFIVVTNFLIYVGIVLVYIVVAEHETGISLGFGIVALVSARILNWQQDRLELKTTLMRNAYLVGAWLVFPYALYHLAPAKYVGLAWVGLALAYYAMNWIVRNQKYRWMGHATLLLTLCYVVVVGTSRFEPVYRVLSFLVLGTVLLIVSLVFTRLRKRRGVTIEGKTANI